MVGPESRIPKSSIEKPKTGSSEKKPDQEKIVTPEQGWDILPYPELEKITRELESSMHQYKQSGEGGSAEVQKETALHRIAEPLRDARAARGLVIIHQPQLLIDAFEAISKHEYGKPVTELTTSEIMALAQKWKLHELTIPRLNDAYYKTGDNAAFLRTANTIMAHEENLSPQAQLIAKQNMQSSKVRSGDYREASRMQADIRSDAQRFGLSILERKVKYGDILSDPNTSLKAKATLFQELAKEFIDLKDPIEGNRALTEGGIYMVKLAMLQRTQEEEHKANLQKAYKIGKDVASRCRSGNFKYPIAEISALYLQALVQMEHAISIVAKYERKLNKTLDPQYKLDLLRIDTSRFTSEDKKMLQQNLRQFGDLLTNAIDKRTKINYLVPMNYHGLGDDILKGGQVPDESEMLKYALEKEKIRREKERKGEIATY